MRISLLAFALLVTGCGARSPLPEVEVTTVAVAEGPLQVTSVATGLRHTCAVMSDGTARCWGYGVQGQLGDGDRVSSATPVQVKGLAGIAHLSLGTGHSCAASTGGEVWCWGDRSVGQVGDGGALFGAGPPSVLEPVFVSGVSGVEQIALGDAHSCARTPSGVQCWGINDLGELGDGDNKRSSLAHFVLDIGATSGLALGASHACARTIDGTARCWGSNEDGQLGGVPTDRCGSFPCARRAVEVSGLSSVAQIAVAGNRSCARLADGTAQCWGLSSVGSFSSPRPQAGVNDAIDLALGRTHACFRKSDRTLWCWGGNGDGQLGFETTERCPSGVGTCSLVPRQVPGLGPVASIALGGAHTCARLDDGTLWCWGANENGQLGDGTRTSRSTPAKIVMPDTKK